MFEECQKYTFDAYWKDVFHLCACNKFPKGVRYSSQTNTLTIKTSNKLESFDLPTSSKELVFVLISLFREKLRMFSPSDLQIKQSEFDKIKQEHHVEVDCEWKKLKPKSIKEIIKMNYIIELSKKYQLTQKEQKQLLNTINLAFHFKKLSSDHIEYSNGKILNIKGLEFDEEKREWYVTNKMQESSSSNSETKKTSQQNFNSCIDKWIREVRARQLPGE